jgi:protocatechuate 3,4-dioxygenase beta subunit
MLDRNRRRFLHQSGLGLAAVGVSGLVLRADALPTLPTVGAEEAGRVLIQMGLPPKEVMTAKGELKKVTPMSYGPWYKPGSPFRGKLCPPGEPGTQFVLSGRVWAFDTRRPLPGVVLEFWHVDTHEKYSDGVNDFRNRGRLLSSETGSYEVEGIRPIPYRPNTSDSSFWRCAHFHLLAVTPGYKPLVTEIHFKDDPKQKTDQMYRPENAIAVEKRVLNGVTFETAVFDIVLERETSSK